MKQNSLLYNRAPQTFPEQNTTSEDVSSGVVKYLEWTGTDIEVVDGDVIIWGKFKVDF